MAGMFDSVDHVVATLLGERFRATRATATAVYLAAKVGNPLFIQGPHGVGKSSLARAIAGVTRAGLLDLRTTAPPSATGEGGVPNLLLMDDLSGADETLLTLARELLAETPPTDASGPAQRPWVVLTSSARDGSLAKLRERCRTVTLAYPPFEHEVSIVLERVPGLSLGLAGEVCNVAARLRTGPFVRPPGVGESISWARALVGLRCSRIDAEMLDHSAARLFSLPEDVKTFRAADPSTLVSRGLSCAA